jgi:hypothetical protein
MAERSFDLTLNPESAMRIVTVLRDVDAGIESTDDDTGDARHDDLDDDDLERLETAGEDAEDPRLDELEALVESLSVDAERDLVALMWLGRGDFSADEWAAGRKSARERVQGGTAQYLTETPLAPDYIEEGLTALGYDVSEYTRTEV